VSICKHWEKICNPPGGSNIDTRGSTRHTPTAHRSPNSPPATENFARTPLICLSSLFDDVLAEHEPVHAAPAEGAVRFGRRVHDRLALEVERGVEDHGHAGGRPERLDQAMVQRRRLPLHRLESRRPVAVRDGGWRAP